MADKTRCEREGLTPIPDHGVLLIDCTVHGPVGVIAEGEDEYYRAALEFSRHLGKRRCQDCADDPDGPCPMCAVALFGGVEANAYFNVTDERDQLRDRVKAALALTEPHPLRHWDTQWPIRAALEGMTAAEYAGERRQVKDNDR